MSEFVQRLDRRTGKYIKIEVASGRFVGEPSQRKFADAEEIEPIEIERRRAPHNDPMRDFR